MKVVFDKNKLVSAVTPAAGISQIKNTIQTIEGLLFECPPDPGFGEFTENDPSSFCRISAFDLEKGLRTSVECEIIEEGKCVINTSRILQIIRALPDGDITIDVDDNLRATVTGGNSSFEISVFPGEDFPSMPKMKGDKTYTMPQHILKKLVSETIFAAAQNDQRVAFNGELFKIQNGKLTVVGCDGNRLSCASSEYDLGDVPDCEVIIPSKFLTELVRLIRDTEDEITMIITNKHIVFNFDSIFFFCRMIESRFIDYERALPTTFTDYVYVSSSDLRSALERASIISEDKLGGNNKSKVKLIFSNDNINISAVSSGGSINENIPASMSGEETVIGFTCRLLLDALKAVPESIRTVRIGLNGPEKGICIEVCEGSSFIGIKNPDYEGNSENGNEDGFDFLHFVMPRRITK